MEHVSPSRCFVPLSRTRVSVQPVLKGGSFKNNKDPPTGLFASVSMLGSKGNIDLFIGLGASTSLGTLYCGLDYDSSSKIIEENGLC